MIQSSVATYVNYQFGRNYPYSTEILYIGLLFGALFWGITADIVGRKIVFNSTLLLASIFGFLTGGMNSFATYGIFLCLNSMAVGGNLALDVTVFLEFLPFKWQWLTTLFACWWGVGQAIAVLLVWAFIPTYSCDSASDCTSSSNRGWRYCWYVNSAIVLVCSLARVLVFKMEESPKFLISNGKDEEALTSLKNVASKYGRTCSLTIEQLARCGEIVGQVEESEKYSTKEILKSIKYRLKILFQNRLVGTSSCLIFVSWFLIGITYATYSNFIYQYIQAKGGDTGSSTYVTYRDSAVALVISIFGPVIAGCLIHIPRVGRRGTMTIGGLVSMCFLFGYTSVRTEPANLAFSSMSYMSINIYYGCLYAYTPEVLPAAARTTGAGIALVMNRIAGTIAPVIAFYGGTGTSIPIWVCGGCIGFIGVAALFFPFEPTKQRPV